MEWYYVKNGAQQGPVPREELDRLVASGEVPADGMVWYEGMENWEPYSALPAASPVDLGPEPTASGDGGASPSACSQCGRSFPVAEMTTFGENSICMDCKPAFFQRVQEGASNAQGGGTFVPQSTAGSNGMAIAGLVVSIVSIFVSCCWPLGAIGGMAGMILSFFGLRRANSDPNQSGKGLAIAGLVISIIVCLISFIMFILFILAILNAE